MMWNRHLIKTRRDEMGLTVPELAKVIGVVPGAVYNFELGAANPSPGTLLQIADALDLTLEELCRVGARK